MGAVTVKAKVANAMSWNELAPKYRQGCNYANTAGKLCLIHNYIKEVLAMHDNKMGFNPNKGWHMLITSIVQWC